MDINKLILTKADKRSAKIIIAVSVKPVRMKRIFNSCQIRLDELSDKDFKCILRILNTNNFKQSKL